MKKLRGKLTLLVNGANLPSRIIISDADASLHIAEITVDPLDMINALSRLGDVPCEIEYNDQGNDKFGKIMEHKEFIFEIPQDILNISWRDKEYKSERLRNHAQVLLNTEIEMGKGWIAEGYFGSKNSFFTDQGVKYARARIRRWVEKESTTE